MNEVVTEKDKECFRDSADECIDLGNEAARILPSTIMKWIVGSDGHHKRARVEEGVP